MIYRSILALLVEMNLMNIFYKIIKKGSILLVSSHCLSRARKEGKYWCCRPITLLGGRVTARWYDGVWWNFDQLWSFSSPWAASRHLGSTCVLWPSLRSDVLRLQHYHLFGDFCVNGGLNQGQSIKKKHFLTHRVLGNLTFCPVLILQGASFKHIFVHTELLVRAYLRK